MIAKGTIQRANCLACMNTTGVKKLQDCYFEKGRFVALFRCMACGGISKATYSAEGWSYVSGPRKRVYSLRDGGEK